MSIRCNSSLWNSKWRKKGLLVKHWHHECLSPRMSLPYLTFFQIYLDAEVHSELLFMVRKGHMSKTKWLRYLWTFSHAEASLFVWFPHNFSYDNKNVEDTVIFETVHKGTESPLSWPLKLALKIMQNTSTFGSYFQDFVKPTWIHLLTHLLTFLLPTAIRFLEIKNAPLLSPGLSSKCWYPSCKCGCWNVFVVVAGALMFFQV